MRRVPIAAFAAIIASITPVEPLRAQGQPQTQSAPAASMSQDEITAFAKVQIAISLARDSIQAQLALTRNKTAEAQRELRDKLQTQIAEILHHNGLTEEQYQRKTYVVSVDSVSRKLFDSTIVKLTGAPLPGQVAAGAGGRGALANLPAGPVGTHIGHVVTSFGDTPMQQGLLVTAIAEARVAAQHATLAARQPTNLDGMKLHAGHVLHALDPSLIPMGPGLGYGVKKAATGVANHIDLAAKAQGASANVVTHANHIATSAKNTVQRADRLIALAQKVQTSTTAQDAAALINQMAALANQLVEGADTNGDGRIGWQEGEGGLQQAEEHVGLMLMGER